LQTELEERLEDLIIVRVLTCAFSLLDNSLDVSTVAARRMHIKKQKVPPAFLEALSRPFADAEGSQRIPSHVENLRHKLADYYRHSEDTTAEKADAHHYWEQSGQVMKWIGEHIVKSKEYTQSKSKIPKIKFHRHLVAGKVNRLMKDEPLAYVLGEFYSFNVNDVTILILIPTFKRQPTIWTARYILSKASVDTTTRDGASL
jgi:hypothetical protein